MPKTFTCFNCKTIKTGLYRRDTNANIICNACGLYYRKHKRDRPAEFNQKFKRDRTKRHQKLHIQVDKQLEKELVKFLASSSLKEALISAMPKAKSPITPPPSGRLLTFAEFVEYYGVKSNKVN